MIIEMSKRKYNLRRRAERQEETRERIVEAMVALHQELGPRDTTISAIADRAGVQRLTVYRHFPDDRALLRACTSHWLAQNPPPDATTWHDESEPMERVRAALRAVYRYYSGTDRMWSRSYRDVAEVEALQGPMDAFERYLDGIRDDLLATLDPPDTVRGAVGATLRHCLRFSSWQSLELEGLEDETKAALAAAWTEAVGRGKAS